MKYQFKSEENDLTHSTDYIVFESDPDLWICRTNSVNSAQLIVDALNFYTPKGLHHEPKNQIIE